MIETPLSLLTICLQVCAKLGNISRKSFTAKLPAELIEKIEIIRARKIFFMYELNLCVHSNMITCVVYAKDINEKVIEDCVTRNNLMATLEKWPTSFIAQEYLQVIKEIDQYDKFVAQLNLIFAKNAELLDARTSIERRTDILIRLFYENRAVFNQN